jgi:NADPH:quinone reductase-like Zn-dependent oxidoreductase
MQAIVQDTYGSADVLELRTIDTPTIGEDEVLVQVRAAGLDRGVWHLMTGLPYPIRVAGYGLRSPKMATRGRELAGVVTDVGAKVTRFTPGDEVFGIGEGTFATFAVASEDKLAAKPASISFEEAAAVSISALTALQAVRDQGAVTPGQRVLVIGASGGVGTFAVQIAKTFGAEVTGVCSTAKVELVRSLGADRVIDYMDVAFADEDDIYDVIIDTGGNTSLSRLRRVLAPKGTLVIVGGETGGKVLGGFDRGLRAAAISPFIGQKLKAMMCSENHDDLVVLAGLVESGAVRAVVDRAYPLSQAPDAIRDMEQGSVRGKVVITV